MGTFLFRRVVVGVLTLWVIFTLCFFIMRFAPGSPITQEKGTNPEVKKNLERHYGLDKPLPVQYIRILSGYVQGDMGPSFQYRDRTVNELIWPAFRVSILLGLISFILAILFGIPLGMFAAASAFRTSCSAPCWYCCSPSRFRSSSRRDGPRTGPLRKNWPS